MAVGYASGELIKEDFRTIKDSDSHGWVQVYFPEYGWIDFEPTPKWDKLDRSFNRRGLFGLEQTGVSKLDIDDNLSLDSIDDFLEPECAIENEFDFPYCDDDILEEAAIVGNTTDSSNIPYSIIIALLFIIIIPIMGWIMWIMGLRGKLVGEKQYIKMMRLATLAGIPLLATQTPIEYGVAISESLPSIRESVTNIARDFARNQYGDFKLELDLSRAESDWIKIRKALISRILSFKFLTK
jgi:hypothetical protein